LRRSGLFIGCAIVIGISLEDGVWILIADDDGPQSI
jgi:hypothetical protein